MEDRIRRSLSSWPSLLVGCALLLVFVAERLLGSGALRVGLDVLAALGWVAGVGLRLSWMRGVDAAAARLARLQLLLYGILGLGFVAYAGHLLAFGHAAQGRGPALLYATFMLLVLCASAALLALELTAARMRPAGFVEGLRVRDAATTGATLVLAVAALLALNYVAEQRSMRWDLSFGSPSTPSTATLSMVQASEDKVQVFLFFPGGNRLLAEVLDYFDALERGGAELIVQDQAADPELADKLKVTGNGYVAIQRGERNAKWYLGTDLEAARARLKRMDRELRTLLAQITVPERVVYFTTGHGERPDQSARPEEAAAGKVLRELVRSLNGKPKSLGLAEGLGGQVPDDASLVVVFGPSAGYLPEEARALAAHVERGGSLLLLLDPGVAHGLQPVLDVLGVAYGAGTVCNDKAYIQASNTPADRAFVVSNAFASHAAVKSLSAARDRAAVALRGAGQLTLSEASKGTVALRSMAGSFEDLDGNFEMDGDREKRAVLSLMTVHERSVEGRPTPGRSAVLADSDALGDQLVGNRPNLVLGYELTAWLLGDDKLGGEVDAEEDVPIQHTREGDTVWFYATTFVAPLLVLGAGLGLVAARRRRRRSA